MGKLNKKVRYNEVSPTVLIVIGAMLLLILLAAMLKEAHASTVTFTDQTSTPTNTIDLSPDGRVQFRILVADNVSFLRTESVLVTDETGQIAPGCYQVASGQEARVTSEVVPNLQPINRLTGRAYQNTDCTGEVSVPSNPIIVEFVPEAPLLTSPLP